MKKETVWIRQATAEGWIECEVGGVADLLYPNSKTRRGRVQGGGAIFPTITAQESGIRRIEKSMDAEYEYRIRKLTPLEVWRVMDFKDEDFHKVEGVISNTHIYACCGNSICRNVLVAIFGQMIPGKEDAYKEET